MIEYERQFQVDINEKHQLSHLSSEMRSLYDKIELQKQQYLTNQAHLSKEKEPLFRRPPRIESELRLEHSCPNYEKDDPRPRLGSLFPCGSVRLPREEIRFPEPFGQGRDDPRRPFGQHSGQPLRS